MKRGKQNLGRAYFYLLLYVVFLSLFKINRIAVSFFVKKYGLHDCQPFLVLCLIFWRVRYTLEDFKKSLSSMSFALEGYYWVMLSALSLFILFPVVFSVAFWSSFAYVRTILYFLPLFTTKSDTFFLLPHHKKGLGVGES